MPPVAHPFDLTNTLAHLVGPKELSDALCVSYDALNQLTEFFAHVAGQIYKHRAQRVINAIGDLRQCLPDPCDVPGDDQTMLSQQSSDLVHQSGSICHQSLTNTMNGLDFKLFRRFDRHEPHGWSTNSFGIVVIILVGFDLGRYELW